MINKKLSGALLVLLAAAALGGCQSTANQPEQGSRAAAAAASDTERFSHARLAAPRSASRLRGRGGARPGNALLSTRRFDCSEGASAPKVRRVLIARRSASCEVPEA